MNPENTEKICVECRASVPHDADVCPNCGYPFDDDQKMTCGTCNSIVVADVDICPVCGAKVQEQGSIAGVQLPEENDVQGLRDSVMPESVAAAVETALEPDSDTILEPAVDESSVQSAVVDVAGSSPMYDVDRLQVVEGLLAQLTAVVQTQLAELQASNQQILQQSRNAAADVEQSEGPTIAGLAEMVAELRTEVAGLADKGVANATTLQGAVNSLSAKVAENAASRALPSSLQWLDYMFVAIIVSLIFSMGNLLIMAYIARLIMSIEFE